MIDPQTVKELQQVPGTHHHYMIVVLFVVGYLMHGSLQVDDLARKNKILRRKVLCLNWPRMAARFFVSTMLFILLWTHPAIFTSAMGFLGLSLSPNWTNILTLPMNPAIAGCFGYAADSLLAYIPLLKSSLPPPEMMLAAE